MHYSLNISGRLVEIRRPLVMGILNVTPDSFYADSRACNDVEIERRVEQLLRDGSDIIDIGGCSTRPDAEFVDEREEWRRVDMALRVVRRVASEAVISVDTFRADIARRCVLEYGAQIVNDVSGGMCDDKMFDTVAELAVPYVLTHAGEALSKHSAHHCPTPSTCVEADMQQFIASVTYWLAERVDRLHQMGVADVIVDPGFGFGKTTEQCLALLGNLKHLRDELNAPLLVGISRKSMVYKPLGITPDEALEATLDLQQKAIAQGADIIRTHDPRYLKD